MRIAAAVKKAVFAAIEQSARYMVSMLDQGPAMPANGDTLDDRHPSRLPRCRAGA